MEGLEDALEELGTGGGVGHATDGTRGNVLAKEEDPVTLVVGEDDHGVKLIGLLVGIAFQSGKLNGLAGLLVDGKGKGMVVEDFGPGFGKGQKSNFGGFFEGVDVGGVEFDGE